MIKPRIRKHVGNGPIQVHYVTVKQSVGKRPGKRPGSAVVPLIWVSARTRPNTVSVTIGLPHDGRLATTMGTPKRR